MKISPKLSKTKKEINLSQQSSTCDNLALSSEKNDKIYEQMNNSKCNSAVPRNETALELVALIVKIQTGKPETQDGSNNKMPSAI